MVLLARKGFDEDHASFRDSVGRFVADEVAPHLDEWRAARSIPTGLFAALGEQGFLGTAVPEEFGGGGVQDQRFAAVLVEELSAAGAAGLALVVARHIGVAIPAVLRLPESSTRTKWLSQLTDGTALAVVAPGEWSARSVPGGGHAGLVVLVDGAGALRVAPESAFRSDPVALLAGFEVGAADVTIVDEAACVVASASDLSALHDLWSAVASVAAARAALDLTLNYVRERKVFGRPIAAFENTRFRLAELASRLAGAQMLVDEGLSQLSLGALEGAAAAAARLVAEDVRDGLVDQGIQLHGGYGYMREYPIAHAFGDARFARIASAQGSDPRPLLADALGL